MKHDVTKEGIAMGEDDNDLMRMMTRVLADEIG
jgi:hypothetical protein